MKRWVALLAVLALVIAISFGIGYGVGAREQPAEWRDLRQKVTCWKWQGETHCWRDAPVKAPVAQATTPSVYSTSLSVAYS